MVELLRTNDMVLISWLTALLADAGVEAVILDGYTSVVEGSVNAIERRLMVVDGDAERAWRALDGAGIGHGER